MTTFLDCSLIPSSPEFLIDLEICPGKSTSFSSYSPTGVDLYVDLEINATTFGTNQQSISSSQQFENKPDTWENLVSSLSCRQLKGLVIFERHYQNGANEKFAETSPEQLIANFSMQPKDFQEYGGQWSYSLHEKKQGFGKSQSTEGVGDELRHAGVSDMQTGIPPQKQECGNYNPLPESNCMRDQLKDCDERSDEQEKIQALQSREKPARDSVKHQKDFEKFGDQHGTIRDECDTLEIELTGRSIEQVGCDIHVKKYKRLNNSGRHASPLSPSGDCVEVLSSGAVNENCTPAVNEEQEIYENLSIGERKGQLITKVVTFSENVSYIESSIQEERETQSFSYSESSEELVLVPGEVKSKENLSRSNVTSSSSGPPCAPEDIESLNNVDVEAACMLLELKQCSGYENAEAPDLRQMELVGKALSDLHDARLALEDLSLHVENIYATLPHLGISSETHLTEGAGNWTIEVSRDSSRLKMKRSKLDHEETDVDRNTEILDRPPGRRQYKSLQKLLI